MSHFIPLLLSFFLLTCLMIFPLAFHFPFTLGRIPREVTSSLRPRKPLNSEIQDLPSPRSSNAPRSQLNSALTIALRVLSESDSELDPGHDGLDTFFTGEVGLDGSDSKPRNGFDFSDDQDIIVTVEDPDLSEKLPEFDEKDKEEKSVKEAEEDRLVSLYWTIENEKREFKNQSQLEAFILDYYGVPMVINMETEDSTVETGEVVLEENIKEDCDIEKYWSVELEKYVVEENGECTENLTTKIQKCQNVQRCRKILIRSVGLKKICRNQLFCPKD